MKCRFKFSIRWTGFCDHIILMDEISVMLIFNNHLQCLQTNNCILPMKKIVESNDKADKLSCFKFGDRSKKIRFWKQISMFHDIICCRRDSLISQLSLSSIFGKIKKNCQVPHHGLFVQQREYWIYEIAQVWPNQYSVRFLKPYWIWPLCVVPKDRTANWVMPSLQISVAQRRVHKEHLLDLHSHLHVLDSHSQMTQEMASFRQQYWDKFSYLIKFDRIQQGFRRFSEYWSGQTWAISLREISYWETDETGPFCLDNFSLKRFWVI